MKNVVLLGFLCFITGLLTVGCGKNSRHIIEKEIPVDKPVPVYQVYEGYFFFELGGELKLLTDKDGFVTIQTIDELATINFNNDYAILPRVNVSNKRIGSDGKLKFTIDLTYTSKNDVEVDGTTNNITGKKRTDFLIYKDANGDLKVDFKIFDGESNDNPNSIIVSRSLRGY